MSARPSNWGFPSRETSKSAEEGSTHKLQYLSLWALKYETASCDFVDVFALFLQACPRLSMDRVCDYGSGSIRILQS